MPLYIDVGVARIQQYVDRWPALRGRRGASALLVAATHPTRLEPHLPAGCHISDEVGRADGVVHLVVDDTDDDQAGPAADERAETVVGYVLGHLRETLTAAELVAGWATADSYTEAHPHIRAATDTGGDAVRRSLPAPVELPPVDRCNLCRDGVAVGTVSYYDDGRKVTYKACTDCIQRNGHAPRGENDPGDGGRTAEGRLLAALDLDPYRHRVTSSNDLAALGPSVRGLANHLATVKIDGNAIGAFFTDVTDKRVRDKPGISHAISTATWTALHEATAHVRHPDEKVPVIPHLVGGDDVLVSLPAARAWPFTVRFLRAFEDEITTRLPQVIEPHLRNLLTSDHPTVSASIAFARTRHPLAATSQLAEDALRVAKRTYPGQPAISWADHTRDGDTLPPDRCGFTLVDLEGPCGQVLDKLQEMGQSRIHALEAATAHGNKVTAKGALRRNLRRLDVPDPVATALHDGDISRSRDLLQMARWWPNRPQPGTEAHP